MTIRALIVDDEAPARGEMRYLLAAHPELEIVGEAATAAEFCSRLLAPMRSPPGAPKKSSSN